jgi:hypothetical protein
VLGVSKTTIRRAEEDGDLSVAEVGAGGEHLFDERELRRFALRYQQRHKSRRASHEGEAENARGLLAAQMFERFDQGSNPVDVVKELSFDPDLVEKRHEQWARMRGLLVLPPTHMEQFVNEMHVLFQVPPPKQAIRTSEAFTAWTMSVADKASVLHARASKPCARCKRASPTTCDACTQDLKTAQRTQLEEMKLRRAELEAYEAKRESAYATPASQRPSGDEDVGWPEVPRDEKKKSSP